jgi:hypothetical protein
MDTFFVSFYGNISMKPKFTVLFMEDAREFLASLDDKSREKIIYNID